MEEDCLGEFLSESRKCPLALTDGEGTVLSFNARMREVVADSLPGHMRCAEIEGVSFPLDESKPSVAIWIGNRFSGKRQEGNGGTLPDLELAAPGPESFVRRFLVTPLGNNRFLWALLSDETAPAPSQGKEAAFSEESLVESLVESDYAMVALFNVNGTLERANTHFYNCLRLPADKPLTIEDAFPLGTFSQKGRQRLLRHFSDACTYVQQDGEASIFRNGRVRLQRIFYSFRPLVINGKIRCIAFCAHETMSVKITQVMETQLDMVLEEPPEESYNWLWACDAEGRMTEVGDGFYDASGFERGSMIGHKFSEDGVLPSIMGGDDLRLIKKAIAEHRQFLNKDVSLLTPLGRRWIRSSGYPVYNPVTGEYAGYRGASSDISYWRKVQDRLQKMARRNELLVSIVEVMPVGLVLHDAEHEDAPIAFVNDHFCEMSGYSREEIIGQSFDFLFLRDEQHRLEKERSIITMAWARVEEGETLVLEEECYRKDGTAFPSRALLFPILDEEGAICAFARLHHDLTEEREREERELKTQRLIALGELSRSLAHEVNNLLQPIISLTEFVRDAIPGKDAKALGDVETIAVSARKIREIVRNVMRFSDHSEEPQEILVLNRELRDALSFIRRLLPDTIRISERIPEMDIRVRAGRTSLVQVIVNLCVNASQAMGGLGEIGVYLSRERVTSIPEGAVPAEIEFNPGLYARIDVVDHGVGIDEEAIPNIFDPFFTSKSTGTGLGLTVVFVNVSQWGGFISVESAKSGPTRFTIHVPILVDASTERRAS